ncbi:hypothetical protein GCM10011403_01390 [Pseudohongiella nitratireducens]|uniref:OmpR/PhoB-type domain-containing protein n=1 Tax=Pseudohongiella nitratireducens TaxID=1768907 RepID=A0A917GJD0_9GAMM|nr:winged helix-turn-helix domain-containing protein [Pseudohongiella nitratireducens]GGG48073.1 hypothetical protein GCM10011403_01390 [Pseudohongiella nitratireducens]
MTKSRLITNHSYQSIRIGDWEVSPGTCTVSKIASQDQQASEPLIENKVTPRSMDVLRMLIDSAGQVVSPGEFLEAIWQSPIATDHAVHKAIAELRHALEDRASKPQYIKTIPKRGYTLIAEVSEIKQEIADDSTSSTSSTAQSQPVADVSKATGGSQKSLAEHETASAQPAAKAISTPNDGKRKPARFSVFNRLLAAAALIAVVIAAPVLVENPDTTPEAEGIVNLVVLPFSSRDFSDENQILADGIREALTHGLSKLNQIQVMSPPRQPELMNASLQTDSNYLRQADHILQGSVMTADDHIRVIVQLVRADDGLREYSDQFDLPMDDIFAVQDQIVENVVNALRVYLNDSERREMQDWGTTNPLAYERFLRGEFYYNQFNPADWQRAIDYFEAATELDPNFMNAYHGMARAANNLAVYSGADRIEELFQVVLNVHREISRIDPESPILDSIHAIKLRMRGSSYIQQEVQLREQILSGHPPQFAMAHYALMLIGARMYEEAIQFLDKASEAGPYALSPDEIWSYRHNVLMPYESIIARKEQLQQRPYHVSYLGTVAINLALLGDFRQSQIYLNQQQEVDEEGILAHYSENLIEYLGGNLQPGTTPYQDALSDNPDKFFNNGALAFMLGDIETGVKYWQNLQPVHLRRLFNVTHSAERFFPDEVVESPAYQQVLEDLGAGHSWQRRLMEGVISMQSITGVALSRKSRQAYDSDTMMTRNNLWSEQEWSEYQRLVQKRLTQTSTLNAARVH